MRWVTHLGGAKFVLILASLGLLESILSWVWACRNSNAQAGLKPSGPPVLPWLGVPMVAALINWLKGAFGRPRPAEVFPGLDAGVDFWQPGRSFPSGHATLAFALATAISFRWPKAKGIAFTLAALVALSRVALGLHWPSDVVAGVAIGGGVVFSVFWVERFLRRRWKIPCFGSRQ